VSVTTPAGFRAAGMAAGLKASGGPDLAIVINDGPTRTGAAVFTSNRAQANPIRWSRKALTDSDGEVRAIVLNSGGANCFTGQFGYETSALTASETAVLLGTETAAIQVCSTGLIGEGGEAFRTAILTALPLLVEAASPEGGLAAANAILTTDTHAKTTSYTSPQGWSIGGMAKGAGMLAPGLATMLVVLTTDAVLTAGECDHALRAATAVTFDRLDSDGAMSTNDQVTLLASGASGVTPKEGDFEAALADVCSELALQLLGDAEGASHNIAITVSGAASVTDAVEVGRSIARNNLFKTAIFGNDPNWGRVLAAIGTTRAAFDPDNIDVTINGVRVCSKGGPDRPRDLVDLTPREVSLDIDLFAGGESATIWTNDLTHDYVHENSAYSS
jgi:glutamate N-acetyltransferase/amino-acid N-acetyltransferase